MSERDRRALLVLAIVVVGGGALYWLTGSGSAAPKVVGSADSAPVLEKRLAKLRQVAATVPAKQVALSKVDSDLALRDKGILIADTAPQAQARLLEIARRLGKAGGIDVRGGELGQVKNFGADYGEATASVSFECHPEQFVNFMADLSHEPESVAPTEIRIGSLNPKEKTVTVRMTLGALVPKKLVPQKKGFSTF